jgi:hypothetical protein
VETESTAPLEFAAVDPFHRYELDLDFNNNGRTVDYNAESLRLYRGISLYWAEHALMLLGLLTGP